MHSVFPEKIELLVDGRWVQGSERNTAELVNPATAEVLTEIPLAGVADLQRALDASVKGFSVWKEMTAAGRCEALRKAAELMAADKERIATILTMENGKPLAEARAEIEFSVEALQWYAEEGKRAYGRMIPGRLENQRQIVLKEPVGPVAAFAAWNFPAANVVRKIGGALGAGCSLTLKASEETPGTAVAIARCLEKAGLPEGALQLVFGVPDEISSYLLASPVIRKVSLTGSTAVGKLLQRRAAETLKRCTMELGGHAPVIVHHDADIEKSVAVLIAAKYRNAGQVCTSPTRFYVHQDLYTPFVQLFAEKAAHLKLGNGLEAGTQVGPVITRRRLAAIESLVRDAETKGARLLTGGRRIERDGNFFAPTVLADVPSSARILREEPFGPVASIMPFSHFDDVIERANSTPYGLASFVFTRDAALAQRTELALEAGLVGVNNTAISAPETPFGGVNESGYGSEGGIEGLEGYLRTKFISEVF
ncbi:NAD-dependent succinate-semialdehyde dehydrogenase [Pseudaminobacter sp. 19-2017]|uniref:NAD-dependent succinate-semialdehyde dehydrogenase n=2 Tax=Pseudaminobacter soli (ex Zhang et al. 2022) TaxID=2831468 RepID=A0A942E789_9HYPH|nr:NAD-dependent succinate-semialdehyde dehydrogenase [Pseudaminobacter soli]